jgi:hypothetical protein
MLVVQAFLIGIAVGHAVVMAPITFLVECFIGATEAFDEWMR